MEGDYTAADKIEIESIRRDFCLDRDDAQFLYSVVCEPDLDEISAYDKYTVRRVHYALEEAA